MMYHFTYKTTHPSGKFYVGRHSTNNINDNYFGSGKWVKSIKNKNILSKTIIEYFENFEDLLKAESKLIQENIDNPDCMNFNNSAIGFATGNLNPAKTEKERKRRSTENWFKTKEGKLFLSENNVSKREDVKIKRREHALKQFIDETHNFQKKENIELKNKKARERFLLNNPNNNPENKIKTLNRVYEEIKNGTHNFQKKEVREKALEKLRSKEIKEKMSISQKNRVDLKLPKEVVICPHCNKSGGKPSMVRYHFNNCKLNK